jgi:prevent-host-death family protein
MLYFNRKGEKMLSQTVNVDEAKNQLADLLAIAAEGGEVIITQNGRPVARLVPVAQPRKKRIAGLNRGSIWTSEDFDEPLPDEFWMGQA